MYENNIQELREIPITKILGIGGRLHNRKQICCPFHSERTPSCTLYPDNSWKCYGCGSYGRGAIDFAVAMGLSLPQAITSLKDYL